MHIGTSFRLRQKRLKFKTLPKNEGPFTWRENEEKKSKTISRYNNGMESTLLISRVETSLLRSQFVTHGNAVEFGVANLLEDDLADLLVLVVVVVDALPPGGQVLDGAVQGCRDRQKRRASLPMNTYACRPRWSVQTTTFKRGAVLCKSPVK